MKRLWTRIWSLCALVCAFFATNSFAEYDYVVVQTPWAQGIQVRYWNPSNPTWVYIYWVSGAWQSGDNRSEVHLPLPGRDYSAKISINESIKKMDARGLAIRAIRDFDFLISAVNYAEHKDKDFESLCGDSSLARPKPSTLSLLRLLIKNDPWLASEMSEGGLLSMRTVVDSGSLTRLEVLLRTSSHHGDCKQLQDLMRHSANAMKESWADQRTALVNSI